MFIQRKYLTQISFVFNLKTMNIHELKYDMQSQKTLLKVSIIEISFKLSIALLLNSSK